jgi:hypothetical protein
MWALLTLIYGIHRKLLKAKLMQPNYTVDVTCENP